jgi:hypothetical protein
MSSIDWKPVLIIITITIVIIGIIVVLANKKENFKKCVCSSREGGTAENCQDTEVVDNNYASGKLTEYSNLKSPGWDRGPNPGSYRFPSSCGGAPFAEHPDFDSWSEDTLFK